MLEEAPVDADYFQRMALFDLRFRLPEQLLARIDRMSMAASVEARVPFLDHRIVETALRLPVDMQGNLTNQKALLKELATRYLPEKIINRPKDGFTIPLSEVISHEIFEPDSQNLIAKSLIQHPRNLSLVGRELWAVFAFKIWLSKHPARN
jgi:asparagine synthase (glutamine-hydrolysing)